MTKKKTILWDVASVGSMPEITFYDYLWLYNSFNVIKLPVLLIGFLERYLICSVNKWLSNLNIFKSLRLSMKKKFKALSDDVFIRKLSLKCVQDVFKLLCHFLYFWYFSTIPPPSPLGNRTNCARRAQLVGKL